MWCGDVYSEFRGKILNLPSSMQAESKSDGYGAGHGPDSSSAPPKSSPVRDRLRASAVHLVISALVAAGVAALVFMIWYPTPYRDLVGGRELFLIVMGVDLVMGPLLTFVAFNQAKGRRHLARDLATIAALQIGALAFGMHTVWLARPVHVVFEIDRLKVVTAADIVPEMLVDADPVFRTLPKMGPTFIAAVKPTEANAQAKSIELGMAGVDLAQQPATWRTMGDAERASMWEKALATDKVREALTKRPTAELQLLNETLSHLTRTNAISESDIRAIPLMSRQKSWAAFVTSDGRLLHAVPIDLF